jgi:CAAX protease family protein
MSEGTVSEPGDAASPPRVDSDYVFPPPWGFWSTSAWTLISVAVAVGVMFGSLILLSDVEALPDPQKDPWFAAQLIVINVVQVAVLAAAARLAGWPVGRYLGLTRPRGRDVIIGVAAVALLLGTLEIVTHLMGRESVPSFQTEAYRAAQAAGLVPLIWLAFVVAAPIGEEVIFRGFLFRGWEASPLGPAGTIALTSLIFAVLHTQYDWFGAVQTFSMGALFGWLRWPSGSTLLTIALHMTINGISTAWTAAKVAGVV